MGAKSSKKNKTVFSINNDPWETLNHVYEKKICKISTVLKIDRQNFIVMPNSSVTAPDYWTYNKYSNKWVQTVTNGKSRFKTVVMIFQIWSITYNKHRNTAYCTVYMNEKYFLYQLNLFTKTWTRLLILPDLYSPAKCVMINNELHIFSIYNYSHGIWNEKQKERRKQMSPITEALLTTKKEQLKKAAIQKTKAAKKEDVKSAA